MSRALPGGQILRKGVACPGQKPQEKEPPQRRAERAVSATMRWRQWKRGHDLHLHFRGASVVILGYRSHAGKGLKVGEIRAEASYQMKVRLYFTMRVRPAVRGRYSRSRGSRSVCQPSL
jgi:hypothetical protein